MELPKNITQIGESDRYCKVYVEDYVISYIKQINQSAENKEIAIAMYGNKQEENGVLYTFIFGAGRIQSILKETRHLSQAQNQEIEKQRRRFFSQYQFLGYRILNGDMVDGFYICEQSTCRYISGYACFYEKNDTMLAYMLDSRQEEAPPESVDQEKYERVKQKQEERRNQYRDSVENARKDIRVYVPKNDVKKEEKVSASASLKWMKTAAAGLFLVLCVLGLTTFADGEGNQLRTAASKIIAEFTEQKLPDSKNESLQGDAESQDSLSDSESSSEIKQSMESVSGMEDTSETVNSDSIGNGVLQEPAKSNTLMTEDKLTDAIIRENAAGQAGQLTTDSGAETDNGSETDPKSETDSGAAGESQSGLKGQEQDQQEETSSKEETGSQLSETGQGSSVDTVAQVTTNPQTYIIKKGDTLTSISIAYYGTDAKVQEICELNLISNPDNIRFGQKILLP